MKSVWLEKVETELPEILKVVKTCDDPYRSKCFELLLSYALQLTESRKISPPEFVKKTEDGGVKIEKAIPSIPNTNSSGSQKFDRFLHDNNLSITEIENFMDFDSGEIIGTKLGAKGSDITRSVAVLLALWHGYKDGEFSFTTDELKIKTKEYGVEFHNQKRDIKKVSYESKKVFFEKDDSWIVPIPVQAYLAKSIKELNNSSE